MTRCLKKICELCFDHIKHETRIYIAQPEALVDTKNFKSLSWCLSLGPLELWCFWSVCSAQCLSMLRSSLSASPPRVFTHSPLSMERCTTETQVSIPPRFPLSSPECLKCYQRVGVFIKEVNFKGFHLCRCLAPPPLLPLIWQGFGSQR